MPFVMEFGQPGKRATQERHSEFDLSEATEAARLAINGLDDVVWQEAADVISEHAARAAIAAATPLIRAQAREQVAQEILADRDKPA